MTSVLIRDIDEPDRNNFTVLRLVAELAVLVSHAFFLRSGVTADHSAGVSVYKPWRPRG